MTTIWRKDSVRFTVTAGLCLLYSLLRTTDFGVWVKALPILFWLVIALVSSRRPEGNWIIASLVLAATGDVLLDLGRAWLIAGTVPFLGATALLVIAFHRRTRAGSETPGWRILEWIVLLPLIAAAVALHSWLTPHLGDRSRIATVLLTLSVLLLWRATVVAIATVADSRGDPRLRRLAGMIGACGIVANYILYAIDLSVQEMPRDLVIQVYYWGQAFVTWSFLTPRDSAH